MHQMDPALQAVAGGADQCPSTAAGTALAVKAVLKATYPAAVFATAANYADQVRGWALPLIPGSRFAAARPGDSTFLHQLCLSVAGWQAQHRHTLQHSSLWVTTDQYR